MSRTSPPVLPGFLLRRLAPFAPRKAAQLMGHSTKQVRTKVRKCLAEAHLCFHQCDSCCTRRGVSRTRLVAFGCETLEPLNRKPEPGGIRRNFRTRSTATAPKGLSHLQAVRGWYPALPALLQKLTSLESSINPVMKPKSRQISALQGLQCKPRLRWAISPLLIQIYFIPGALEIMLLTRSRKEGRKVYNTPGSQLG